MEVPAPGEETLPSGSTLQPAPLPVEDRAPEAEVTPAWQPAPPTTEQPPREPEEEVPEWLASFAADWTPAPRPVETEEPVTTFPGAEAPRAKPAPPPVEIAPPPTPPQPAAVATVALGVGCGAILQVVGVLYRAIARESQPVWTPLNALGVAAGLAVMYLTGLMVAA